MHKILPASVAIRIPGLWGLHAGMIGDGDGHNHIRLIPKRFVDGSFIKIVLTLTVDKESMSSGMVVTSLSLLYDQ